MKSRYLNSEEIAAIFKKMPVEKRLIFEVALETGLRIGDVLKIKKRDISAAPNGRCEVRFLAEKTKKRSIAFVESPAVAKRLLNQPKGYKGYIFASLKSKSGHITRQAAWKWFKAAANDAKIDIDGCSPHSLRKSFATELMHRKGLAAVQAALQHTNSFTTAIYAYADAYAGGAPESPILWGQINVLLDLIVKRINGENLLKMYENPQKKG